MRAAHHDGTRVQHVKALGRKPLLRPPPILPPNFEKTTDECQRSVALRLSPTGEVHLDRTSSSFFG